MSENKNLFVEEDDRELGIQKKEELLKQAKEISPETDYKEAMPIIKKLQAQWRRSGDGESAYEEELRSQFDEAVNVFYAKQKDALQEVASAKEELVKKAEALVSATEMNKATTEMNKLFDEWKALGFSGDKATDDALWEKFSAARKTFNDARNKFYEERAGKIEEAKKIKAELIVKAEALADSTAWKKTTEEMNSLFEEWKAAGYAGKDAQDELWDKFNAARTKFFNARSEFYAKQKEEFAQKNAQKSELIAKAKDIVAENTYSKEVTEKLKALNNDWKEIGFSGRDKEEKLWKEFKETLDGYYTGLKAANEQKHQDWLDRMDYLKEKKEALIEKQKKQLSWMERELSSTISESAVEDLKDDIEDKKDFIEQLEAELKELEDKITSSK